MAPGTGKREGMGSRSIDRERVRAAVARLRESGVETSEVDDAVNRVVHAAVEVFGLTGAGLMMVDDEDILRHVVATDTGGELLESIQEEIGEGPCIDSLYLDRVVATEDVSCDPRWPELAERLRPLPIGGVLGVPVRLAGTAVASLNVYQDRHHTWAEGDVEALSAFGRVLETVLLAALLADHRDELVQHLQRALDQRVHIERAVGVLMGRHGLDAVAAFNRLRADARSQRRKVIDVAQDLLGAGTSA